MDFKLNIKKFLLLSLFFGSLMFFVIINSNKSNHIKIIIRGPGTCVDLLTINENGKGRIIRGRSKDYYTDEFKKFHTIEFDDTFVIDSKIDLINFNKLIDKIKEGQKIIGNHVHDGKHTEIFINKEKKIDVYGFSKRQVIDMYLILTNHLPYDINSFCESKQLD
jgi:hypothetical protein